MNGRAAGAASPIVFGVLLLISNLSRSTLYSEDKQATYHSAVSALGAFLLVMGLIFLYRNLK